MFKYFKGEVSAGFISIFTARTILRTACSLLGLFLPIFLYVLFGKKAEYVIYFYLIGHLLYAFTVALGARFLNSIGLRRSLRLSIVLGAVYYFLFYLVDKMSGSDVFILEGAFLYLFIAIVVVLTVHRIMYWIPLNTDMAKFTDKKNRAKEVSSIEAVALLAGAIGPIFAGWVIASYSYTVVFIIAMVLYLVALIPLIYLPRTKETYSWGYFETWQKYFSKKRRKIVISFMGLGAEDAVGVVVWPIFIFELLKGNYFEIGVLSSLIVVVSIVFQLSAGGLADKGNKNKMLHFGSVLYALGWIVKIFVITAMHIFIVSAFHGLTKIFARTPFDAMTFEKAADQGHFVDEFTVIHEMAIQFGKAIMLIFVLISLQYFSLEWSFLLAAVASLFMNFLADKQITHHGRHAG